MTRRRLPVPAAVLVAVLVSTGAMVGWPQTSTGASSASCGKRGDTVLANLYARVYTLPRGDIEVHACRFGTRSIGQHAFLGFRSAELGSSRFRLEGYYVGYLVRGTGCSRSGCEGDFVELTDTRRPRQPGSRRRKLPGTEFALRSDGVFATVTGPEDGSPPVVSVWDRDGAREVGRGRIAPDSLALSRNAVYWTADGLPHAAPAPGPAR